MDERWQLGDGDEVQIGSYDSVIGLFAREYYDAGDALLTPAQARAVAAELIRRADTIEAAALIAATTGGRASVMEGYLRYAANGTVVLRALSG